MRKSTLTYVRNSSYHTAVFVFADRAAAQEFIDGDGDYRVITQRAALQTVAAPSRAKCFSGYARVVESFPGDRAGQIGALGILTVSHPSFSECIRLDDLRLMHQL